MKISKIAASNLKSQTYEFQIQTKIEIHCFIFKTTLIAVVVD
jgi:hypothetical protein